MNAGSLAKTAAFSSCRLLRILVSPRFPPGFPEVYQRLPRGSPGIRDCQRFFDQVGHQTIYAFIGNKHFSLNCVIVTTYKNQEQSRQKSSTFLENKLLSKSKFSENFIFKSCSSSLIFLTFFFRKIPVWTIQYILNHYELFWSGPNCFGWVQIILVRLKLDFSALISKFVPSKIIFQVQIYRFKPRKRSRLHLTIRLSWHILSLPVPLHPTKKIGPVQMIGTQPNRSLCPSKKCFIMN